MKKLIAAIFFVAVASAQTPLPTPINGGAGGGGGTGCVPVGTADRIVTTDGLGGCNVTTIPVAGSTITASVTGAASLNLLTSNNLSDLASAATARTNLGGVVVGPASSTTNDCAAFADTTGKLLKDVACPGGGSGTVTSVGFTGGLISVGTPTTTPAFTVAGTSGGIPYFSSGAAWASSAALTAHGVVIGGGVGTAPTSTAAGTSGQVLTSNGASADPTFQTVTGTGTVTVVGAGSVTSTALVTGGGGTAIQTPSANATMDASGNVSTPGTISSGVGSGNAGAVDMTAGTSVAVPANSFGIGAGATMTTSVRLESPNAVPSANNVMLFGAPSSNKATWAWTGISGTGSFAMTTSPTFVTPALGTPASGNASNLTNLPITLTTTGTSGASTYTQSTNTLNIPQYTGGGTSGGTVVNKSTNYTFVAGDTGNVEQNTGATTTFTLVATPPTMPWIVSPFNSNAASATIARNGNTINGGTSNITLPQYQAVTLVSDTATGGNYVGQPPLFGSGAITLTPTSNALTFGCATCVTGTPTNHGVALGSATQANGYTAVGATNTVLHGNTGADPTYSAVATGDIAANAVTSAKMAVVNTYRTCDISVGDTSGSAITSGQMGPQSRICFIPAAATIVEMDVNADAGTPNVIIGRNRAGTIVNIVSSALATAATGGIACSNTGGTTGLNGATTCSSTLQNTGLNAGDYLELVSGTPGGTAKFFVAHVTYTVN